MKIHSKIDIGKVRSSNQDAFFVGEIAKAHAISYFVAFIYYNSINSAFKAFTRSSALYNSYDRLSLSKGYCEL